jgi:hypothetical protein
MSLYWWQSDSAQSVADNEGKTGIHSVKWLVLQFFEKKSLVVAPNNDQGPQTATRDATYYQNVFMRFLKIIGISTERALNVHNIKPMEDFLDEQCAKIEQRILNDPNHPITTSI